MLLFLQINITQLLATIMRQILIIYSEYSSVDERFYMWIYCFTSLFFIGFQKSLSKYWFTWLNWEQFLEFVVSLPNSRNPRHLQSGLSWNGSLRKFPSYIFHFCTDTAFGYNIYSFICTSISTTYESKCLVWVITMYI